MKILTTKENRNSQYEVILLEILFSQIFFSPLVPLQINPVSQFLFLSSLSSTHPICDHNNFLLKFDDNKKNPKPDMSHFNNCWPLYKHKNVQECIQLLTRLRLQLNNVVAHKNVKWFDSTSHINKIIVHHF